MKDITFNYITVFIYKAFEKLLKQHIVNHLNTNDLFNAYLSRFRDGHSTTSAMIKVLDDIRKCIDAGKFSTQSILINCVIS